MTVQDKQKTEELGQRLRSILQELELRQCELSKASGLDRQVISRLLRGKRAPEFTTIQKIVNALPDDVDVRWLICGNKQDRAQWITVSELECLTKPISWETPMQTGRRQRVQQEETQE